MKRFNFSRLFAAAALAFGALGAVSTANARSDVYFSINAQSPGVFVQQAPVYVHPRPVYAAPQPVYVAPPPMYLADYEQRQWRGDRGLYACGAPRWDPQLRYAPGEVVRRHGALYVARRVSAHIWNLNSPPEWTPDYWAPARC